LAAAVSLPDKLERAVRKAASETSSTTPVTMFFLRRTSSKFDPKKYEVVTVEVEGDVADDLREILSKRLEKLIDDYDEGYVEFKEFFDPNIEQNDLSEIKSDQLPVLKYIRSSMKDDGLVRIHSLKQVKEFDAYAVEFHLPSGNLIYFRRIGLAQLITKKFDVTYIFQRGKFNKIEDDIVAFDKQVDCVYFDYSNSLLVISKYDVEIIFNFKEYYQVHSQAVFQGLVDLNLIEVTDQVMVDMLGNYYTTKRITGLLKEGKFNRTIEFFREHSKYFEKKRNELQDDKIQLEIRNNRVIINNKEKLDTFLNICDDDYVEGVISGISYVANTKEKLSK
jgi:hypothetical protein